MKRKILVLALLLLLILTLIPTTISMFGTTSAAPPDTELNAMSDSPSSTFSIMQISDTQHLAFLSPTLYNETTSWIVNNSANYNLQMVVHTGDFVDAYQAPPLVAYNASQKAQEWVVANAAISKLLTAGIPYCWVAGNHDQDPFNNPNGTMMGSSYPAFNATDMRSKPYWAGDLYDAKNTAVKFTYNNFPFMMINLEYLANSSAIAWMKGLLDKNTGANIIVTTHDYLDISGNYDTASGVGTWTRNLKATLDSYPNIFLALSGHNHGWNMTRAGNREEILFDFQEENNRTGADAARIYTFNLTSKKVNVSTYCIDNKTWLTDPYNQFTFDASLTSDWVLTQDARALKAYPDLREYVWQKDASMQPNGPYDKIGLHRLVKTGITPKGVVFVSPRVAWSGEAWISNPPTDNLTKTENNSQPIYWANRGFDVYAIDYRTHFVPSTLNNSQLAFMENWTYSIWVNDVKEAVEKAKQVSGASKVFMAGPSNGGGVAMMYATKYWEQDLRGIILLDGLIFNGRAPIAAKNTAVTNTYNLTKAVADMISTASWGTPSFTAQQINRAKYALANPTAPAEDPPGTPLTPTINPLTNKTWTNITEWFAYTIQTAGAGNAYEGYTNVTEYLLHTLTAEPFFSGRMSLESLAMADWTNCPYVPYDYDEHFNEINVPLLAFASGPLYSNKTGTFRFINGLATSDFTGIMLEKYGHTDVYMGVNSARDVSEPAYQWMVNHLPPDPTLFGNKVVGTLYDQNDANAQSVSYFTCTKPGVVTDIKAYIDGASAGNCIAAIFAVDGGSAGALLAQSNAVSIGTSFSWVDFKLPTPYKVTAGTTYGLAIMGDVAVNVMEVSGTGQRDHNAVSSYANGFANPFGPVWGTDDRGAMSIYAASSNTYVTAYGQHGEVILQLPTGNPKVTNVTTIRLIASEFNEKSTFGAYDTLIVALWIPSVNQYVPVAQINNINNSGLDTFLKTMFATTPIWNPQMPNIIDLSNKDFNVWTEDGVIIANLTTTVKITLPFNLMVGTPYATWGNQTFDLPPLTLMFRPIANSFDWKESLTLSKPPFSGYTIDIKSQMTPAWVKADIPTWVKGGWLECSGHICNDLVQTAIPPTT